ncbi:hypothetical protein Hanom_Chr17g01547481 [Helianthus anomalus]
MGCMMMIIWVAYLIIFWTILLRVWMEMVLLKIGLLNLVPSHPRSSGRRCRQSEIASLGAVMVDVVTLQIC